MRSEGQYGEDRVRPPHPPACGAAPPGWSQPGTAEEPTPDHLRLFSASTYLLLPRGIPPALAGSPPPRSPALTPAPPCNVQQLTRPQTEASPNQGPPSLPQAYIPLICPHYRQTNQGKVCLNAQPCHPHGPSATLSGQSVLPHMELMTLVSNHSLDLFPALPRVLLLLPKVPSATCTKVQTRPPGSTFEKIITQIHKDADTRTV